MINNKMKESRINKGYSQGELAKIIGVSRQTINMIENGELLGFANACSYYEDDYKSSRSDTFYGECLMIIKPNNQGDVLIKCSSSYGTSECIVKMINND